MCGTRSSILYFIILRVEFGVLIFRVWNFVLYIFRACNYLWYFVLYFSACGITCYTFSVCEARSGMSCYGGGGDGG